MADGDWSTYGFNIELTLSYMSGAFISGIITSDATPYQIHPTYGLILIIGVVFLIAASIFWPP
jgi:hypothetical protein